MNQKEILFERVKLYQLVWEKPMVHLAKDFGLSDTGLRKICKKLKIPLPPAGFWVKKGLGKEVRKEPLPPLRKGPENYVHVKQHREAKEKIEISPKVKQLINKELLAENKIDTSNFNGSLHPLVKKTIRSLKECKYLHDGIADSNWKDLDVRVSSAQFQRSAIIMDALVRGLKKRKIQICSAERNEGRGSYIEVLGEKIKFRLTEKINQRPLSNAEIEKQRKFKESWEIKKYERSPSGKLVLTIADSHYPGVYKRFRDQQTKDLEGQLNSFIMALYEFSEILKLREVQDAERRRQWQEETTKRYEREEKIRRESEKISILLEEINAWQKSKSIREYAVEFKIKAMEFHGQIDRGCEIENYLNWVNDVANRFDPFVKQS